MGIYLEFQDYEDRDFSGINPLINNKPDISDRIESVITKLKIENNTPKEEFKLKRILKVLTEKEIKDRNLKL